MSVSKYKMSISLNVLNHLGLNLYSNTPAVIAEVIANAWDADATYEISFTRHIHKPGHFGYWKRSRWLLWYWSKKNEGLLN